MRTTKIYVFCAILEELQAIYKRSTCIEHVQILAQSPFTTIERTMKEFLKLPCEKEPSIAERKGYSRRAVQDFFTILAMHTLFPRKDSTVFIFQLR